MQGATGISGTTQGATSAYVAATHDETLVFSDRQRPRGHAPPARGGRPRAPTSCSIRSTPSTRADRRAELSCRRARPGGTLAPWGIWGSRRRSRRWATAATAARCRRDWEIWGPMGGYVAAHALRAVGVATPHAHPAAFSCHYLGVARFEPIDILVEPRKEGRGGRLAPRVDHPGAAARSSTRWCGAPPTARGSSTTSRPRRTCPVPTSCKSIEELVPADAEPPFKFWENLDAKPLHFELDWPPDGPRPATWQEWLRFRPTATWEDEWVDACRSVILVDLPSWPSAHRPHAWKQEPWMAPTLDLNVAFHRPTSGDEWLLCDGAAPVSTRGLFGWTARVWSPGRQLMASGGGQCLYRRMRTP